MVNMSRYGRALSVVFPMTSTLRSLRLSFVQVVPHSVRYTLNVVLNLILTQYLADALCNMDVHAGELVAVQGIG